MVPVGFVSDHMEVIYDLDTEAMATAEEIGLPARRAATAGVDPRFVAAVRDLLLERAAVERGDERDAGRRRQHGRPLGPLPGRLLPQPPRRPPGAVRDGHVSRTDRRGAGRAWPSTPPGPRGRRWSGTGPAAR